MQHHPLTMSKFSSDPAGSMRNDGNILLGLIKYSETASGTDSQRMCRGLSESFEAVWFERPFLWHVLKLYKAVL